MVISRLSLAAVLSRASLLTDRTRRARKEAKLPSAARNQNVPVLSAMEARMIPAIKSAGFRPFMTLPTCLSLSIVPGAMLASPSDKIGGTLPPAGACGGGRGGVT
jgi:hypothetical protein